MTKRYAGWEGDAMLEIVAIYLLSQKLRRKARERGRNGPYAALALLWVAGEFLGAIIAGTLGVKDLLVLFPIMLVGAAGGALIAWWIVSSLQPPPGWFPGIRWAGWCKRCDAHVWVTPEWTCERGHPGSALTKLYVPEGQKPYVPGQPQAQEQSCG